MMRMYVVAQAEMDEGNMDSLPELHATSAGLKAFSTEVASQGIEVRTHEGWVGLGQRALVVDPSCRIGDNGMVEAWGYGFNQQL